MSGLTVTDAFTRRGRTEALKGASLHVETGEIVVVLGPSGSGKTSLLRAIAGFDKLQAGQVVFDGSDVSRLKPQRRKFGFLFQSAQLFPRLDVAGNVAYGLRHLKPQDRQARVMRYLGLVDALHLMDRDVHTLSPGQAQRVALARTLAPSPQLLLLDEPFSALDAAERRALSEHTLAIIREQGLTAVHVTHDQSEAFAMADSVAVMLDGQVLQHSDPVTLQRFPGHRDVARLLGARAFIKADLARAMGFPDDIPAGHVVGVLPRSLVADPDGVELTIQNQGFAADYTEVHVLLPDGQKAIMASPARLHTATVRARLADGPVVPGAV